MSKRVAAKKPSGENIPESMRKTAAVKLRLRPEFEKHLREHVATDGGTISQYVEAALFCYWRDGGHISKADVEALRGLLFK